jgi:hypothetical protein
MLTKSGFGIDYANGVASAALFSETLFLLPKILLLSDSEFDRSLNSVKKAIESYYLRSFLLILINS